MMVLHHFRTRVVRNEASEHLPPSSFFVKAQHNMSLKRCRKSLKETSAARVIKDLSNCPIETVTSNTLGKQSTRDTAPQSFLILAATSAGYSNSQANCHRFHVVVSGSSWKVNINPRLLLPFFGMKNLSTTTQYTRDRDLPLRPSLVRI